VFDDGQHVVIDFAKGLGASDLPHLFVIDVKIELLVNTPMLGRRIVVDHVSLTAELRLGGPNGSQQRGLGRPPGGGAIA